MVTDANAIKWNVTAASDLYSFLKYSDIFVPTALAWIEE